MLKIYDGMLKITNPKLYHSPYMVNVNEVRQVLGNFKFKSRLLFMKNLLRLRIEKLPNNMKVINPMIGGFYDYVNNIIYIDEMDAINEMLNHELFHVSGRRYNKLFNLCDNGILNYFNEKDSLNEGIVEYLNLLSKKKVSSNSSYQLELLVIESLITIYGENFLNSYFEAKRDKFYNQFGSDKEKVKEISILLNTISSVYEIEVMRLNYLLAHSLFPEKISEEVLKCCELSKDALTGIKKFFINNPKIYLVLKSLKKNKGVNIYNYPYSDHECYYYLKWESEYKEVVQGTAKIIIDNLIELFKNNDFSKSEIETFIRRCYNNKNDRFKQIYGSVIEEKLLLLKNKRVYSKGRGSV